MTADHISIVMATLNGARHLTEQLDSIARQSHGAWSLFASDDGSTDGTRAILQDFAHSHPVHLVDGPRAGAAANFLTALCHPDLPPGWVALADQDDVWLPGKLARALRVLQADEHDPRVPALYASESVLTDDGLLALRRSSAGRARPGFCNALGQNLFGGHTMVLNPAALALIRAAGVPQRIAFHDWWIYQLVSGAGGRLILDPAATALYRQHGANSFGGSGGVQAAWRRLAMAASGQWRGHIQAQATAVQHVRHLLTDEARETLDAFLNAPGWGPARLARLRRIGLCRSSAGGTALMMAAALLGRA